MSNDKVQSIMALVAEYPYAKRGWEEDHMYKEIESAIREAIAAPGMAVLPSADEIRLACGEISPQEMRTVLAVLGWHVRRTLSTAEQPTPPATSVDEAARSLAKWLNERPNRPINLEDVAMLVHFVQSRPVVDKSQLKRLVSLVFGEDFQIVSIKGGTAE